MKKQAQILPTRTKQKYIIDERNSQIYLIFYSVNSF